MVTTTTREWIRKVLQEHHDLRELLGELRDFLDIPRPSLGDSGFHTWAAGLSAQLVGLHNQLYRHFQYEEEGGMMSDLEREHPRANHAIHTVLAEHPQMLRETRLLVTDALKYSEGREPDDRKLRRRVTTLLDQLTEHERAENDLILSLELEDLGAVD